MTKLEKLIAKSKNQETPSLFEDVCNLCKELEKEIEFLKKDKTIYEYIWVRIVDGNHIDSTYFITDDYAECNLKKDCGWIKIEESKKEKK